MHRWNGHPFSVKATEDREPSKRSRAYREPKRLTQYMIDLVEKEDILRREAAGEIPPEELMKEIMHFLHHNGAITHKKLAQTLQLSKARTLVIARKLKAKGLIAIWKEPRKRCWMLAGIDYE